LWQAEYEILVTFDGHTTRITYAFRQSFRAYHGSFTNSCPTNMHAATIVYFTPN